MEQYNKKVPKDRYIKPTADIKEYIDKKIKKRKDDV